MLESNENAVWAKEMLTDLRSFFHDVRRKYFPPKTGRVQPVAGLPAGLDASVLDAVVRENFGSSPVSTAYVHLSGWKAYGAYRLMVETKAGRSLRLIYKNALYTSDQIPALVDLPFRPGPPEYVIYSQAAGPMAGYLPQVYLAEERVPGIEYHYIFEDLADNYRRAYTHDDILHACRLLPGLYQALDAWARSASTASLIQYDRETSLALETYAKTSLERFSQSNDDPLLKNVLSLWPEITAIHAQDWVYTAQERRLIHGDANYSNIHLHLSDPNQLKLVDWEWAGLGLPSSDLASLLKGTPSYIEKIAVARFAGRQPAIDAPSVRSLTSDENTRIYQWCCLERALLDAAFLAAQSLRADTAHKANFSLSSAVTQALKRLMNAYKSLSR